MKVLVLGGSGGCGRWLVRLAAERGHKIRAAVRPTTLTEGALEEAKVVDYYGLRVSVSRADVAAFMLNAIEQPTPISDRTPMIASARRRWVE